MVGCHPSGATRSCLVGPSNPATSFQEPCHQEAKERKDAVIVFMRALVLHRPVNGASVHHRQAAEAVVDESLQRETAASSVHHPHRRQVTPDLDLT